MKTLNEKIESLIKTLAPSAKGSYTRANAEEIENFRKDVEIKKFETEKNNIKAELIAIFIKGEFKQGFCVRNGNVDEAHEFFSNDEYDRLLGFFN